MMFVVHHFAHKADHFLSLFRNNKQNTVSILIKDIAKIRPKVVPLPNDFIAPT